MASGKNQYWSQRLLNMLNGAVGTIASPLFLALYTVAPTVSTAGTEVTNAGAYASFSITGNTTNWPTITGTTTTMSSGAIFFGVTAATADWSSAANIVAAALKDSATNGAGNIYYFGSLTESKPVLNGDTPSFAVGAITIQEL